MTEIIKLNNIPSYLKNSGVYKILLNKNVKYLKLANIPLYELTNEDINIKEFEDLVKTIYFWKIEFNKLPIQFYLFCFQNQLKLSMFMDCYVNDYCDNFKKYMLFNKNFAIIHSIFYENYDFLSYVIDNDWVKLNFLFADTCMYENLNVTKFVLTKAKDKHVDMFLMAIHTCATCENITTAKFILDYCKDNNYIEHLINFDYAFELACNNEDIVFAKWILDASEKYLNKPINIHCDYDIILNEIIEGEYVDCDVCSNSSNSNNSNSCNSKNIRDEIFKMLLTLSLDKKYGLYNKEFLKHHLNCTEMDKKYNKAIKKYIKDNY